MGSSPWEIRSIAGLSGLGGKEPPEWLKLHLTTDKQVYRPGENITFTAYLDNNSTNSRLVLGEARLIINIYPSSGNPQDNIYNVDAWRRVNTADGGGQALEPSSSIVLAHPFEWDQGIMKDGILTSDSVSPGRYTIDASLGLDPEGIAIYDQKEITIAREQ